MKSEKVNREKRTEKRVKKKREKRKEKREKRKEKSQGTEDTNSEINFKGGLVAQVRDARSPPEPEKIQVLQRVGRELKVVDLRVEQSLGDCFWEGSGTEGPQWGAGCWIQLYRWRGWDYSVDRKWSSKGVFVGADFREGARVLGGGNSILAGDLTCGNCHQPGCWNARSTCYRCGAPRNQEQGGTGQGNSGGRDMGGRYQEGCRGRDG